MMIKGRNLVLRALEPGDIELLYAVENDPETWKVSNTLTPFSRYSLEQYIITSGYDIFTTRQLRLMIELKNQAAKTIGSIDLFDYDPFHRRAGIGIIILAAYRKKGYAAEALSLLLDYVFNTLNLNQVYCSITVNNPASLRLFENAGFISTGVKKQWIYSGQQWFDEYFMQLLKENYIKQVTV